MTTETRLIISRTALGVLLATVSCASVIGIDTGPTTALAHWLSFLAVASGIGAVILIAGGLHAMTER